MSFGLFHEISLNFFLHSISVVDWINLSDPLAAVSNADLSPGTLLVFLAFATLASEDLACVTAGTLAAQNRIGLASAMLACAIGIFVGDILLYGSGRLFGKAINGNKVVQRIISAELLRKGGDWLNKRGSSAILLSRFTPGLRLPVYVAAGILKTDFLKFASYFLLAVSIWTPVIVGSTYLAGAAAIESGLLQTHTQIGFLALIVGLYFIVRKSTRFLTWRSRRIEIGKLKRIIKWEFWPIRVFYFPVVLYVLFLGIKYRSLTLFTAANPSILGGGLVGESKDAIYRSLSLCPSTQPYLLRYIYLSGEEPCDRRLDQVLQFMDENSLSFPIVLKPDIGERGKDVKIVRDEIQLRESLTTAKHDCLAQEYFDGQEMSIFYHRNPDDEYGEIFSMTEKRFPILLGDGISTLEELILKDERAVCLAEKYFEQNEEQLSRVPEIGEPVPIVKIGTHSKGAVFVDGGWWKSEALAQKIDEICQGFDGFYFGRFDLKAPNLDDFQEGKNFRIIELNGVSSESTNIYDPMYSLFDAYRILFTQWRIAFEIGAANKKRGTQPTGLLNVARLVAGSFVRSST